jgi:hypothetical protein
VLSRQCVRWVTHGGLAGRRGGRGYTADHPTARASGIRFRRVRRRLSANERVAFAGDTCADQTTPTKLPSDALRRRLAAVPTRPRRGATAAGTAVAASTVSTSPLRTRVATAAEEARASSAATSALRSLVS